MKMTAAELRARKARREKIVVLTSYDYPTALFEDACGVDVQLIGDSVGTNVLGLSDVSEVTVDIMTHHLRAVARGAGQSFVLCDMPFGSFTDAPRALETARHFVSNGADGVKMEGEEEALGQIRHCCANGISVCAHIGYTPQTDGARARVQGKDAVRAIELLETARQLEKAGAFMLVLELIPEELAREITRLVSIPTIGIGAGRFCDGQVQVVHDILGLSPRVYRHSREFADLKQACRAAISAYAGDVRDGRFPEQKNASELPGDVLAAIREWSKRTIGERA